MRSTRSCRSRADAGDALAYDIVGPVCETGDFLASDRRLAVAEGDLLAVMSAGAYGMSMSSNYNSRPRAAEIMVDGERDARHARERDRFRADGARDPCCRDFRASERPFSQPRLLRRWNTTALRTPESRRQSVANAFHAGIE